MDTAFVDLNDPQSPYSLDFAAAAAAITAAAAKATAAHPGAASAPSTDGVDAERYVWLDPHVLATPAINDIDGDGAAELLLAVSYFFDAEHYQARVPPPLRWGPDGVDSRPAAARTSHPTAPQPA